MNVAAFEVIARTRLLGDRPTLRSYSLQLDNDALANNPSGFCARNLPIDLQHDPAIDDRFVFLVQRIGGGEQKFLFCPVAEVIAAREAALHIVAI